MHHRSAFPIYFFGNHILFISYSGHAEGHANIFRLIRRTISLLPAAEESAQPAIKQSAKLEQFRSQTRVPRYPLGPSELYSRKDLAESKCTHQRPHSSRLCTMMAWWNGSAETRIAACPCTLQTWTGPYPLPSCQFVPSEAPILVESIRREEPVGSAGIHLRIMSGGEGGGWGRRAHLLLALLV